MSGVVPDLDKYIENNLSILLSSLHGVGKTYSVMQACKDLGLKMKYYSSSTLDPYTDLIGVPVPVIDPETGEHVLKMVRPREIDDAEVVFFDEMNRAAPAVRNACLEMVQFRTINGEKLPNLKCVIAAVNPPNDERHKYDVDDLDPALLDRFHVTIDLTPRADLDYFRGVFGKEIGTALVDWWDDQNRTNREAYLSPRRLEMIGQVWLVNPVKKAVEYAMPTGGKWEVNKLVEALREASITPEQRAAAEAAALADAQKEIAEKLAAAGDISEWQSIRLRMAPNREIIALALANDPSNLKLHSKVASVISKDMQVETIIVNYADVLANLSQAALSSMADLWSPSVRETARKIINESVRKDSTLEPKYAKLRSALDAADKLVKK